MCLYVVAALRLLHSSPFLYAELPLLLLSISLFYPVEVFFIRCVFLTIKYNHLLT